MPTDAAGTARRDLALSLRRLGPRVSVEAGVCLLRQDTAPRTLLVLETGRVALGWCEPDRQTIAMVLEPPDVVGDVALFARSMVALDVWTLTPCRLIRIPSTDLLTELRRDGQLTYRLLAAVAERGVALQRRVQELLIADVSRRVAVHLAHQPDPVAELSQEQLAELLGLHRTTVNRVLHELESAGALRLGYRSIEIIDRDELRRIGGIDVDPAAPAA